MKYVRCIKNEGFIYDQDGKRFDHFVHDLIVGRVYKVAPPGENDGASLRVIEESGEDYLYPPDYFEQLAYGDASSDATESVTVHLPPLLKGILRAEALVARKSLSALLREWVDERLDLPAGAAK